MNKTLMIFMIFVLGSVSLLCTRDFEPLAPMSPVRALTQAESQIVSSSGKFGIDLFKKMHDAEKEENIFISPLSVSMALGMAWNGANGETATAMQNTLGFAGMSRADINASYKSLLELLSGIDPKVRFDIANSIWYRLGFEVEQSFFDLNKTYFDAEVAGLDFGLPSAVTTINSWVEDNTNGKIDQIIESIDPMTVMFLINAIYFNGTWTYEFDKAVTKERPFYPAEGKEVLVPTMAQTNDFAYYQDNQVQIIDMPYGNGAFRMTVVLPAPNTTVDAVINGLSPETWQTWLGKLKASKGTIYLPKFKLEYEQVLNQVLTALGMGIAFEPGRADFTNINKNGGLYISQVRHKTFVDVYEEGTEAAAVTIVEIRLTSVGGEDPGFTMRVDRPFFFTIREQNTGTLLFMGKIINPGESK